MSQKRALSVVCSMLGLSLLVLVGCGSDHANDFTGAITGMNPKDTIPRHDDTPAFQCDFVKDTNEVQQAELAKVEGFWVESSNGFSNYGKGEAKYSKPGFALYRSDAAFGDITVGYRDADESTLLGGTNPKDKYTAISVGKPISGGPYAGLRPIELKISDNSSVYYLYRFSKDKNGQEDGKLEMTQRVRTSVLISTAGEKPTLCQALSQKPALLKYSKF